MFASAREIELRRMVEAKRKLWGEARDTLLGGVGVEKHLIVRRFPGVARSSF
jgi:hypothetical protein